jgi:hypothetical protein
VLLCNLPWRAYHASGDTYLQLYDLDLDRPEAILAFAKRRAHLGGVEMLHSLKEQKMLLRRDPDEVLLEKQIQAASRAEGPGTFEREPLEAFRFAARLLGDLTSAWRVVSGQAVPDEIDWQFTSAASQGEARALLRAWVSPLLRGLHPRLEIVDLLADDAEWAAPAIAHTPPPFVRANLYEVCAAELFNHIADQTQYKTCANETCHRLFVLQHGRAVHGQHRTTGVKYCSSHCARAQSQRVYRRRQKAS